MTTLLAPAPPATARLLAVRTAGAAFDGPFRLRSRRFEALLAERAALGGERERARAALLESLHAAVPAAPDREARRALLAVKRDVFNGRAPGPPPAAAARALAAELARFAALLRAEEALWEKERASVADELRQAVDALLRDPAFAAALRYASPGLREELARGGAAAGPGLPGAWRGVYGYAARFFAKANPFHLFAGIILPRSPAPGADEECELVLNAAVIAELERELLPLAPPERVRLSLRPWTRGADALRFWVPAGGGLSVVSLRATAALEALVGFLAERGREAGRPVSTRAECEAWLSARLSPGDRDRAGALLDALVERGALAAHLVTDPDRFAAELAGLSADHEARIAVLGRHHLVRTDVAGAARAHSRLAEAGATSPDGAPPPFYVNRYPAGGAPPECEAAAERVGRDLRALKPFFAAESSFDSHRYVMREFVLGALDGAAGGSAPLLELLGAFLRDRHAAVVRYLPERHRPAEERSRLAAWRAGLAAQEGMLSAESLAALPPFPGVPAAAEGEELCFNGPFDFAAGIFHVSNVFAGAGRFASRYLLHRGRDPWGVPKRTDGVLDVEVSIPPPPNLHYVLRALPTGCGFDGRRSHLYARWVCPSDVLVERREGGVAYRHAVTAERLRFHYRGFALAAFLPAEYQILLLEGHADAFLNPFDGADPPPAPGEARHRPGLRFGRVQLRRERWSFRGGLLEEEAGDDDPLRFAARLRDWVHSRLRPGAELWYYRSADPRGSGRRPRFLDLRAPPATQLFRRALARGGSDGIVSMSVMEPGPRGLLRLEGRRHVAELMIEA